jgi:uncharacterized protein (TIGR02265 family)
MDSYRFRPADFDAPVDFSAQIERLPPGATSKGMFFSALFQRASARVPREVLAKRAGLAPVSYLPFGDYSMADNMRLTVEVARVMYPMKSLGQGLRELGAGAFDAFLGSHLGRTILSALDVDPSVLFRLAPKLYATLFNFGRIEYQQVGQGHCRLFVTRMPIFIETFQVGSVESALRYTRCVGTIALALDSLSDGVVDVHWQHAG